MKKFAIISTILILLAGGLFGYSLYNYIQVDSKDKSTDDQVMVTESLETLEVSEEATEGEELTAVPDGWDDKGMFSSNYSKAYTKVQNMSNEELAGLVILGTCDSDTEDALMDITKYKLGGYWFSGSCFANKTEDEIKTMVRQYKQRNSGFIAAVDEEGGSVTAVTDHDAFIEYSFDSPRSLFEEGGLSAVEKMEKDKLTVLKNSGINLNLAPVLDLATDQGQIMYSQSLGADSTQTGQYAQYVVKTLQDGGVSACAKHFPGYGTTEDTYEDVVTDSRPKTDFEKNDFLPFKSAIAADTHFIMVSNVLVTSLDDSHIASLSESVHNTLRSDLGYTGIIITDNLDNGDYSSYSNNSSKYVGAILAGNDMIIADDIETAYNDILNSLNDGTISEEQIQKIAMRVLAYKYTAGLM